MKKNLLVSLCLGTVFAVAADANASSCQINSGAYAGISAGLSAQSGKSNFTDTNNGGGLTPQKVQNSLNSSLSKNSLAAAIFGGYGMKFSGFWVAAEAFYQFDKLNTKDNMTLSGGSTGNILKSSSTGAYGAAIHLGFVPNNNCIAYAILGVEARRFKVNFADTANNNISAVVKKGYTSIAFAPGVGVRFALSKNLSLRTEYKYAMHGTKKITASARNAVQAAQTDIVTIKHKPQIHSFNVGLVYSF
jgi:opacity protein-like surface antigen